jgi:hypothetical protein
MEALLRAGALSSSAPFITLSFGCLLFFHGKNYVGFAIFVALLFPTLCLCLSLPLPVKESCVQHACGVSVDLDHNLDEQTE